MKYTDTDLDNMATSTIRNIAYSAVPEDVQDYHDVPDDVARIVADRIQDADISVHFTM